MTPTSARCRSNCRRRLGLAAILGLGVAGCGDTPSASPPTPTLAATAVSSVAVPTRDIALAPRLQSFDGRTLLSWIEVVPDSDPPVRRLTGARWIPAESRWERLARDVVETPEMFANWADLPGIAPGPEGSLLAWWLQSSGPGVYTYDVRLALSEDQGSTWQLLGVLHDDGTASEHGFVSAFADESGWRLQWLDGRRTVEGTDQASEPASEHDDGHGHGHGGPMTLRTTRVELTDARRGTARWHAASMEVDGDVCDCCNTAIAPLGDGWLTAYRDRHVPTENRAIRWQHRGAGAAPGDSPTGEGLCTGSDWITPGCPVNGPSLAVGAERVAAAWYLGDLDARDPGLHLQLASRAKLEDAADSGAFDRSRCIAPAGPTLGSLGRPALAFDAADRLWLLALQQLGPDLGVFQLRAIDGLNAVGPAFDLAPAQASRADGFPQLLAAGPGLLAVVRDAEQGTLSSFAIELP